MKAILRGTRISAKKVNLVAGLVRKKSVPDALAFLKFTPKKAAGILHKVILSAASNAVKNFSQEMNSLYIREIVVNEGPTLKRFLPVSKGRAHPILKRTTHIIVTVGGKMMPAAAKKAEKPAAAKKKEAPAGTKKVTKAKTSKTSAGKKSAAPAAQPEQA